MMEALFFANTQAMRAWLADHAATSSSLLVGYYRVKTGQSSMSWSASVDEALCFGWIDGRRKRIDDHRYSIQFTPRQASSIWSVVNIAKVEKLRAKGCMTPAGERAFAARSLAKSGVYYHEQDKLAELSLAEIDRFKCSQAAWDFFEAAPPGYRKRILHWVTSARKDETRASRLGTLIQNCAAGIRIP